MAIINYGVVKNAAQQSALRSFKAQKPSPGPAKRNIRYSYLKSKAEEYKSRENDPQYRGEERAMTASEKRFYAYNRAQDAKKEAVSGSFKEKKAKRKAAKALKQQEANLTDDDIRRRTREAIREKITGATTKVRKQNVGLYVARTATAKDIDERGKLPTKDYVWKAKTYERFK